MNISLLQPQIIRGNIEHNRTAIQKLIDNAQGELLVLPEYALTGSLVLDLEANIQDWAHRSAAAKSQLTIPAHKQLLLNSLAEIDGKLANCSELLPTQERQLKLFPDQPELDAGIAPGTEQKIFMLAGKRFKVVICSDMRHIDKTPTDGLDFFLFIFHFTPDNFDRVIGQVKQVSNTRNIRVLVSSLVSDKNSGYSSFVAGDVIVSLPSQEGILEIELE